MGAPTLSKTWQSLTNFSVATTGNATTDHQQTLLKVKKQLVAFGSSPYSVRSSSNSVSANTSDNWNSNTDLVWNSGAHSWIVLRQTGLGSTSDICIDLLNATVGSLAIYYSPGGYATTSLSTTARPSTLNSDEVPLGPGTFNGPVSQWISAGSSTFSGFVNVFMSTDGQCTRWFVLSTAGAVMHATWIEKIQNPISSLPYPVFGGTTGTQDNLTYTAFSNGAFGVDQTSTASPQSGMRYSNSSLVRVSLGGEFFNGQHVGQNLTTASDLDAAFPMSPVQAFANSILPSGYSHGCLGNVADWWFGCSTGVTSGDTYSSKNFIQLNQTIWVWDTSSVSGPAASTDRVGDYLAGVADQGTLGGHPLRAFVMPPRNREI